MINYTELKGLFGLSIFMTVLLAGWYPVKRQKQTGHTHHAHDFSIAETLATGIFLGAGLLHMLPESTHLFYQQGYHYPFGALICGGTFLLFLWLEHLGQTLYHQRDQSHAAFAVLAWLMLSIHSFILGTALGLNDSQSMIMMLFLAIITHKWAESFAIAVQISKTTLSLGVRYLLFLTFACMTPIGICFGWYFEQQTLHYILVDPILMATSAGTFLYLGTLHGLEKCVLVERCCNLRDFSFVIIGFLMMGAVAVYL